MDPEQERVERAQALAVAQAVREALVDRTLAEHDAHLRQINGSQRETAAALASLKNSVERMTVSTDAVAKYVSEQRTTGVSRKTMWLGALGVVAAYGAMIATLLTSLPK